MGSEPVLLPKKALRRSDKAARRIPSLATSCRCRSWATRCTSRAVWSGWWTARELGLCAPRYTEELGWSPYVTISSGDDCFCRALQLPGLPRQSTVVLRMSELQGQSLRDESLMGATLQAPYKTRSARGRLASLRIADTRFALVSLITSRRIIS